MDTEAAGIGEETVAQRLWSFPGYVGQEAAEGRDQEKAQGQCMSAPLTVLVYKTRRVLRIPYNVNNVAGAAFIPGAFDHHVHET